MPLPEKRFPVMRWWCSLRNDAMRATDNIDGYNVDGLTTVKNIFSHFQRLQKQELDRKIQDLVGDDRGLLTEQVAKLRRDDEADHITEESSTIRTNNPAAEIVLLAQYDAERLMKNLILDVLFTASQKRNIQIVQWVLTMKPEYVSYQVCLGRTVLSSAVCARDLDIAKWLVNVAGADILAVDQLGQTVLIQAASTTLLKLDMVRWLVEDCQSIISHIDNTGHTALLYAATFKNYDVVLYLLTSARQSVSDALWVKLQPLSAKFLFKSPGVPSALLLTMLSSSHPVPDVQIHDQNNHRFFARTCTKVTRLRRILPIWLVLLSDELAKWLPPPIVQILTEYSTPSPDEVWSIVSFGSIRRLKKKRDMDTQVRRNPIRAVRKRRMLVA